MSRTPEFWADWLVDAVAGATQNRALLRGDPEEDLVLTKSLYLNGLHAIKQAMMPEEKS